MAATVTRAPSARAPSTTFRTPPREPLAVRLLEVGVTIPVLLGLTLLVVNSWTAIEPRLVELAAWAGLITVTDFLPVPLGGTFLLSLSMPLILAAGMVYGPAVAGALAFLGSGDPREFRKEVSLLHGLHNRSQIALSAAAAAATFHVFDVSVTRIPVVLAIALLCLIVDFALNAAMVTLASRLSTGVPIRILARNIHEGDPLEFLLGYMCFGLLALLLAVVYVAAGNWGVASYLVPLFLARQMFVRGRDLHTARIMVEQKTKAFLEVSERIADERRDERLRIAAGLHDEVLPPLYKVHLMGQVLKHDLSGGRLLALEDDLPDLLQATDQASEALRALIRDLRRSPLGSGGVAGTLRLLVRQLQTECRAQFVAEIHEVSGSPLAQLLAYQVAREALRNAVRHSGATLIRVHLESEGPTLRVTIEDNGKGFSQDAVDDTSHFGLLLMRERVELAGGLITVESRLGAGTRVTALLPADIPLLSPKAD